VQGGAHSEKAAFGQHSVCNLAASNVKHDVRNLPDMLAVGGHDHIAVQRGGCHHVWARTFARTSSNDMCTFTRNITLRA
jgi:hypothetical protein